MVAAACRTSPIVPKPSSQVALSLALSSVRALPVKGASAVTLWAGPRLDRAAVVAHRARGADRRARATATPRLVL